MLRRSMLIVSATSSFVFACAAVAFGEGAPSPLPSFDVESGAPYVAESIINQNTLQDIEAVQGTATYDMARVVARVEDLTGEGFCSGFRVGEDLFMTNFHCWEVADCQVQFHMGYEKELADGQQAKFKCTQVLDKFEHLDYALFRVARVDANTDVDFPIAALSKKALTVGMPLLVPGHPAARPKQVDISDECHLTRAVPYDYYDRSNIQHQCDTEGGSSGSPVMDRTTGHIIGIHWGATGGTDSNHAIPMSLIIERLATTVPDAYAELTIVED